MAPAFEIANVRLDIVGPGKGDDGKRKAALLNLIGPPKMNEDCVSIRPPRNHFGLGISKVRPFLHKLARQPLAFQHYRLVILRRTELAQERNPGCFEHSTGRNIKRVWRWLSPWFVALVTHNYHLKNRIPTAPARRAPPSRMILTIRSGGHERSRAPPRPGRPARTKRRKGGDALPVELPMRLAPGGGRTRTLSPLPLPHVLDTDVTLPRTTDNALAAIGNPSPSPPSVNIGEHPRPSVAYSSPRSPTDHRPLTFAVSPIRPFSHSSFTAPAPAPSPPQSSPAAHPAACSHPPPP